MPSNLNISVWSAALEKTVLYLPRAGIALVLLLAFWLIAGMIERLIQRTGAARMISGDAIYVIGRTANLSLICVGVVTALGTLGVDVSAMVTGLGLTGFAVGFALKDIISNLLAGILILIYKPFQRHDRIMVLFPPTNLEGHVAHVDLRYTTLELPDRKVLIPNANLFTNPITVFRPAPAAAPPAEKPPTPAASP
jgi:small-conductance mechanosensitive channel